MRLAGDSCRLAVRTVNVRGRIRSDMRSRTRRVYCRIFGANRSIPPPGELQSPRSHALRGNGLFGRSASVLPQVQGKALVSNSFDAERRNIAFPRRAWERGFFALCSSPDTPTVLNRKHLPSFPFSSLNPARNFPHYWQSARGGDMPKGLSWTDIRTSAIRSFVWFRTARSTHRIVSPRRRPHEKNNIFSSKPSRISTMTSGKRRCGRVANSHGASRNTFDSCSRHEIGARCTNRRANPHFSQHG